jgi:hypothetical protein
MTCDRCGSEVGGDGGITVRVLGAQLPRPRFDLCGPCFASLERWLSPPRGLADHIIDAIDLIEDLDAPDDQGEDGPLEDPR